MNSRAFSCGERSLVVQPEGNAAPTLSPEETWMSLNTTRPHCASGGVPIGVLKVNYCTDVGELP